MAFAVAEAILGKLGRLAVEEAGLFWDLNSEVLKLKNTFTSIRAVLLDAEEQSGLNHQVQVWLDELKQVFYEADDLLDDLSTEALLGQQHDNVSKIEKAHLFFSDSNPLFNGLMMAHRIKAIRIKLDEIYENRMKFNLQMRLEEPATAAAMSKLDRRTDSFVPNVFVGREEDSKKILSLLLSSNNQEKVQVVPILGVGGLGKTALAQWVYNDTRVTSHFQLKIWVCVSDSFNVTMLVKNILESLTEKKEEDLQLQTLKTKLKKQMDNKKFLLVLDDVWDTDNYGSNWDNLMSFLCSVGAVGSKAIVTTRDASVAGLMATKGIKPHELKGLSKQDSWSLFNQVTFKGEVVVGGGERFTRVGEEIVRRCVGVPLAIRAMAGILLSKRDVVDWENLRDKQARLDRVVSSDKRILATLRLSYDSLPSYMKPCFAYCSLFPRGCTISVRMLVQLWMGQGYVHRGQSSPSSNLYDTGVEYFKSMLSKSFFQEMRVDRLGDSGTCKMHDLMHGLALEVAGKENFTLKVSASMVVNDHDVNFDRLLHLSFDFEGIPRESWQVPNFLLRPTKLRTLLPTNLHWRRMNGQEYEAVFSNVTSLRVLSLCNVDMKIVPPSIHKLKRLRYLNLSYNSMKMLPDEVTTLVNLQVLILDYCEKLQELPRNIVKLSYLECLSLHRCDALRCLPSGIGKLTSLKELSKFVVTTAAYSGSRAAAKINELKDLNLSGRLNITGLESVKERLGAEIASLKGKPNVVALDLSWGNGHRANPAWYQNTLEALEPHENLKELTLMRYSGWILPTWFSHSLKNVMIIRLNFCTGLRVLPALGSLVSLEELMLFRLDSLEYVQGEEPKPSSSSAVPYLPRLKSLTLGSCSNLISWWSTTETEAPLFPCLSSVQISDCNKLVSVPRVSAQLEKVELAGVKTELLRQFAAASLPPTLPRFKSLKIGRVEGQGVLVPELLLPRLVSLECLLVQRCPHLTTLELSPQLQSSSTFTDYNGMPQWYRLPALLRFEIVNLPRLERLPEWLQRSSKLQLLEITQCEGLECLPDWLPRLTALETLEVHSCARLSPMLESRMAVEWRKVAHIPNIRIDYKMVQRDGNYLEEEEEEEEVTDDKEDRRQEEDEYKEVITCTQFLRTLSNSIPTLICFLLHRR